LSSDFRKTPQAWRITALAPNPPYQKTGFILQRSIMTLKQQPKRTIFGFSLSSNHEKPSNFIMEATERQEKQLYPGQMR